MKTPLSILFLLAVAALPLWGQSASDENEGSYITAGANAGDFVFSWWGVTGRTYFVQQSSELMNWNYIAHIESGTGAVIQLGTASNTDRLFWRLVRSDIPTSDPFAADFDGDGWGNMFELQTLATDPLLRDTDADGTLDGAESMDGDSFSDAWEMLYYGDLTTVGPGDETGDPDGDGISNLFESQMRTDPNVDQSATASNQEQYSYSKSARLKSVTGGTPITFVFDEEGNLSSAD